MNQLERIAAALEKGEVETVIELTNEALGAGLDPGRIVDDGLIAGMTVVGGLFRKHEIFLPDVLMAAKAMNGAMEIVKPLLTGGGGRGLGRVVIGTIEGDLHDIGKNLVGVMLKGAGFDVIDLGSDVSPGRFVDTAVESGASVIGMSALLTTTMANMEKAVRLVKERRLDEKIRVIVGGAPLSEEFAARIGADAYGFDASSAVERVAKLVGEATR